jgi:hypothetical protein
MVEPRRPGPGQSTAEAAFDEVKKEVARRNAKVQAEARKLRTASEMRQLARRRQLDSL